MWRRAIAATMVAGVAIGCNGKRNTPATDTTAASAPAAPKAAQTDFTSGGPYIFVSNEDGNNVTVISAKTDSVVATLEPGQRPRGLRVSPDGKLLIVAVSGSPKAGPGVDDKTLPPADRTKDGIALIDLSTGQKVANLPGGLDPEAFAISSDGKTIYVSNEDGGTLTLIDVDTRQIVGTVPIGSEPEGVQIHPDNKVLYATNEGSGTVSVLDLKTKKIVATVPTGKRPRGIAFTPDGTKAYITNEVGGTVTIVDAKKHKVLKNLTIPGEGAKPMGTAMAPDGEHLYVTTGRGGTAVVIDTKNDSVGTPFLVGKRPWGIAVSADGKRVYTANGPSNDISVIDASTNTVTGHIPGGKSPWGIAISKERAERAGGSAAAAAGSLVPRSLTLSREILARERCCLRMLRALVREVARVVRRADDGAHDSECARDQCHAFSAALTHRVAWRSCDRTARRSGDTRPASSSCARSRGAPPDTPRAPSSSSRAR